ncbi:hypothetical protein B0J18DRAFT_220843 [Chaetomium sp. MPI-SDFR-AT-0129]|nr:hypothetical protein B0J18DRAFT_220843 [Chaetomium sp. MPI-SDFR-AT-0129]
MSAKPITVWDHDAHLTLLQAIMAEAPPPVAAWDKILARVAQKGYNYTSGAVQYCPPLSSSIYLRTSETIVSNLHSSPSFPPSYLHQLSLLITLPPFTAPITIPLFLPQHHSLLSFHHLTFLLQNHITG